MSLTKCNVTLTSIVKHILMPPSRLIIEINKQDVPNGKTPTTLEYDQTKMLNESCSNILCMCEFDY